MWGDWELGCLLTYKGRCLNVSSWVGCALEGVVKEIDCCVFSKGGPENKWSFYIVSGIARMPWRVEHSVGQLKRGILTMMMMNGFCGMVDRRKAFRLISSRDHCQRSLPSRISDTPQAGFEPAQNLSSGLVE